MDANVQDAVKTKTKWTVGNVKITKVVELETLGGVRFVLPQATHEEVHKMEWLTPHFALDARLRMAVQSFVVETPGRTILVDTGIGNKKQGRGVPTWNDRDGPFLDDLKAAGYPIDSFDTVFMTHLHVDHVGFNTTLKDGKWVPTFPKARHIAGKREFDYWAQHAASNDDQHALVFNDSMKPVVDAGLLDTIGDDAKLTDEVSVLSTPGHSPGHLALVIKSGGQEVIIAGDLAHHPCQMAHIDWSAAVDYDGKQSAKTRQDFYARYAGTDTLILGGHFTGAGGGRVVKDGSAFRLAV
jgi:glyoxylase-like metal-dependent hydrolase (beta-lactamase superfamily II)